MTKMHEEKLANLSVMLDDLKKAKDMLVESFTACQKIALKNAPHTKSDLVELEAFSGRFARVSDLLLQKIFRSLDSVELSEGGTLLDVLHRAQKRNIIDDLEKMFVIRDLRNMVVHEYLPQALVDLFDALLKETPNLIKFLDNTLEYGDKLTWPTGDLSS